MNTEITMEEPVKSAKRFDMVPLLMDPHWKKFGTVYPNDVRGDQCLDEGVSIFSGFHPSTAVCPPRVTVLAEAGGFRLSLDLSPTQARLMANWLSMAADEAEPLLDKWTSIIQFEATPCTSL